MVAMDGSLGLNSSEAKDSHNDILADVTYRAKTGPTRFGAISLEVLGDFS
jgi:hypothetical protein